MSYDIWLEADLGGPEPLCVADDWNYTSNCAPMWRAAGADLATFDGKKATDCIGPLSAAIETMRADPERFRAMDPPNSWGSYDEVLPVLDRLLGMFRSAPVATVVVSR